MTQAILFIRLLPVGQAGQEPSFMAGWLKSGPLPTEPAYGRLDGITALASGCQVVVLVPAADVLLTRLSLPTRNRKRLQQAIPYALEDQLIGDIDTLHFAIGEHQGDGTTTVAVAADHKMQAWLSALAQAGIKPDALIPEVLLVSREEGAWTLWHDEHGSILRTGAETGHALEQGSEALMLQMIMEQPGMALPASLTLIDAARSGHDWSAVTSVCEAKGIVCNLRHDPQDLLMHAAREYTSRTALNLMQDRFACREHQGKLRNRWRLAIGLLAGWVVLHSIFITVDYWRLRSVTGDQQRQMKKIYLSAFPDAVKVIEPRVQMEQRLKSGAGAGGQATREFLHYLSACADVLNPASGAQLQRLRYQGGELSLDMTVGNVQMLEQVKQQLGGRPDLRAEIITVNVRGDQTEARLQISGERP